MSDRIKVLYFHHAGSYGGSSRSLGMALPGLMEKGVEVTVVAPVGAACDYFRTVTDNVIPIDRHCVPLSMTVVGMKNNGFVFRKSFLRPHKQKEVKRIIQQVNPDLVHCNELGLISVAKTARKLGKKVVMHARTMPHKDFPGINNWVRKQLNRYSDFTICITGSVAASLPDVQPQKVIYNPIEKLPHPLERGDVRSPVIFLSLSAIQKSKGVFDIVEAANMLKNEPNIKIRIAGLLSPHNPADLTLKQRLQVKLGLMDFTTTNRFLELIEKYQLNNLELLGHIDDVDSEIAKCDVVIAPMHLNAPPRSIYEAGIFGLPSILSMEDKVQDVLEHEVTGLLIDEQSPQQLADAMLLLAKDQELRNRLGAAARIRCTKNHNPQRCADEIHSVYESVLK